jgi:hypothetical protein
MATHRLPTPGSDDGTWGDILNDFLVQAHKTDGSLADDTVGSSQLQNGSISDAHIASGAAISKSKLSPGVQSSLSNADTALKATKAATAPSGPSTDDLWYDSANDQWKRWNGSAWVAAGSAAYVPLPSAPSANGLLQYDSNTSKYIDIPPIGELVSSTNESQSVMLVSSAGPKIEFPANTITVPSSDRPVWIEISASCEQTVVGDGLAMLSLYDTTINTTVTFMVNFFTRMPCPTSLGTVSRFFTINGALRLGPHIGPRTYKIVAQEVLESGSAAQFRLLNGLSSSSGTTIRAVAR